MQTPPDRASVHSCDGAADQDSLRELDDRDAANAERWCGATHVTAGVHEVRGEKEEDLGDAQITVWWERHRSSTE